MRVRSQGFSLLELLIAMTLFLVLGAGLIAIVTRSLGFLEAGSRSTEVLDKGVDFLRPFVADVENILVERSTAPGLPEIRMMSDYVAVDSDLDGTTDYYAQRFAFVRSTLSETSDVVARLGGTTAGPDAYLDGRNDAKEAESGRLRPLGGQMAVLWMATPERPKRSATERDPDQPGAVPGKPVIVQDPGLLTIYRASQSPLGSKKSLLDRETVRSPEDLEKVALPLLADVLHFGVRFWTPKTRSWFEEGGRPSSDGPSLSWDSTRGILGRGLRPNEFPYALGEISLTDPRDDISPRSIRVTFVFARTGRDEDVGTVLEPFDENARTLRVATTAFANTSVQPYLKIGTEWVQYDSRSSASFSVSARGVRGTVPVPHEVGEKIYAGYVVERTIMIPCYREDWYDR